MKAIKVKLQDAEKVKKELIFAKILDRNYSAKKGDDCVFFPVTKKFKNYSLYDIKLKENIFKLGLKKLLSKDLSSKELRLLKTAYDIIGEVAILEIPLELRKKEKVIAKKILELNKSVRTVLRKEGGHEGEFRLQKSVFLAGKRNRETTHLESRCRFNLNVDKVYFSPRLVTERMRVAKSVKKGEKVLVMFSGCGIYPVMISKNSLAEKIVGVEVNKVACNYAKKNLKLNKVDNIEIICGDVRKILPKLKDKFDRVIMPLPKDADKFLDLIPLVCNEGCLVQMYAFDTVLAPESWKKVRKAFKKVKKVDSVKCCQVGPRKYRVCLDFIVNKF